MKKLFLMGRSEAGKTSLTQILSGEELHYHKTQYTNTGTDIIDSPGEYSETKRCGLGLACFSFEADVLALLMAADEPFSVFEANCQCFTNRPLIGIITKIDSPYANVPMVRNWMVNSGCERIFEVSNLTREGIQETAPQGGSERRRRFAPALGAGMNRQGSLSCRIKRLLETVLKI